MIVLKALFVLTFLSKVEASYDSKFDFSSYEKNSPFFSKKLKDRLREWNKTLMNASRFCANRSINGTGIEEHIRFPVFDTKEIDDEFVLLAFETFHPVLVRKTNQHDLAKVAHLAIAELWPLLVLCFSCAALSGVIIWLLDSRSNSEQFPVCFWRGIFDGMWWAVVTMTTVGYGDKVPKSMLARLFATVWIIVGIILLSMFTAQVSSRLTAQELMSGNHLFGKKIGVPPGLYESSYVDYKMAYSIVEEISDPIESATTLAGESLDSVVVFHCDDKAFIDSLQVLQFLPPCQAGAELSFYSSEPFYDDWNTFDPVEGYVKCMKRQTALQENNGSKAEKSPSCKMLLEKKEKLKFQFQWVYFESPEQYFIPFGVVVGAMVMATITGTVWDCFRQKKRNVDTIKKDTVYQRNAAEEDKPGNAAAPHDPKVTGLEMS